MKLARSFDEETREVFVAAIEDGQTRQEAAETVKRWADETGRALPVPSTAKRWLSLAYRDKEFGSRFLDALQEDALEQSRLALDIKEREAVRLAHRMFDEVILRALDPERGKVGASNRVLHNLLLLKHEDFRPLLEARTRHIHEGAVGIYAMPHIDYARWSVEEHQEFIEIEARRQELIVKAQVEVAPPKGLPRPKLPSGVNTIAGDQLA